MLSAKSFDEKALTLAPLSSIGLKQQLRRLRQIHRAARRQKFYKCGNSGGAMACSAAAWRVFRRAKGLAGTTRLPQKARLMRSFPRNGRDDLQWCACANSVEAATKKCAQNPSKFILLQTVRCCAAAEQKLPENWAVERHGGYTAARVSASPNTSCCTLLRGEYGKINISSVRRGIAVSRCPHAQRVR